MLTYSMCVRLSGSLAYPDIFVENGCVRLCEVRLYVLSLLITPDDNECIRDPPPCDANATCTNVPGSFECNCSLGFRGNGFMCQRKYGVAECSVMCMCGLTAVLWSYHSAV